MKQTQDGSAVRFRGTPASLTAVLGESAADVLDMHLRIEDGASTYTHERGGAGESAAIEIPVQADFEPRILRTALASRVAPGSYRAVLVMDGKERPAELVVEALPQLRVVPEQLRLELAAGAKVTVALTMLNVGNTEVELREVQAFGVFMEGGVERALRRAYVHELSEGERRIDVIADSLAEAHGGLVRMRLLKGERTIEPDATRELELEVHVPRELVTGATYTGNWELPGLVYPVSIHVPARGGDEGAEKPKQPRTRSKATT